MIAPSSIHVTMIEDCAITPQMCCLWWDHTPVRELAKRGLKPYTASPHSNTLPWKSVRNNDYMIATLPKRMRTWLVQHNVLNTWIGTMDIVESSCNSPVGFTAKPVERFRRNLDVLPISRSVDRIMGSMDEVTIPADQIVDFTDPPVDLALIQTLWEQYEDVRERYCLYDDWFHRIFIMYRYNGSDELMRPDYSGELNLRVWDRM